MLAKRVYCDPTLNSRKLVEYPGKLVRVVSGAYPSMRIHFSDPSLASNSEVGGQPIVNGRVFYNPDGEDFARFWIVNQTLQAPGSATATNTGGERLVLDVIDDACAVFNLDNTAGAGWRYKYVAGSSLTTAEIVGGSTLDLFVDNAWGSTGIIDDARSYDFIPRGYIGGAVQADGPFTLYALAHVNKNGTKKVELARWVANTKTINNGTDWAYGVSLETSGAPIVDSAISNTLPIAQGLLAWPLFGLTLVLAAAGTPDIENYAWVLYSRGGLN